MNQNLRHIEPGAFVPAWQKGSVSAHYATFDAVILLQFPIRAAVDPGRTLVPRPALADKWLKTYCLISRKGINTSCSYSGDQGSIIGAVTGSTGRGFLAKN